VAVEAIAAGIVQWYGGSQQEAAGYRYANGSRISVGGLDKPTKIMSSEYDVAYVQEAIELVEGDWDAIMSRLRNGKMSFQQLIADTNPDKPTHWLKARCDAGKTRMLDSRHEDNPVLFDETTGPGGQVRHALTDRGAAYIRKLDNLTGPRYYRLRRGLWVAAEGIIYEEYDPAIHLLDRFPIPVGWPRWWVVDFGYTNPFVLQCWAQDPDGRLIMYREIYHTKRLVEDHAKTIMSCVSRPDPDYQHPTGRPRYAYHGRIWTEPKPRGIICDHDAEDRATLERHLGMGTIPAKKSVSDGIQAFQVRLRPAGDGRPSIGFLRDSLVQRDQDLVDAAKPGCTVEEIVGYVWDTGAGKAPKETPLKVDDHGMDAGRYVVAEQDLGGRPRVRWLG
jgi:phage terminase large subunit